MIKEKTLSQESFDALLKWLDENRETAGQKYEKIRKRLIRIFIGRGCFEPEELADETITRVTLKISQITENYDGEPILYFFGVAQNVYHEWLRKQQKQKNLQFVEILVHKESQNDVEYDCLERCLGRLPADQRELIIEYYKEEKKAKIENRQILAKKLGVNIFALQTRAHRIRAGLRKCLEDCLSEKKS